MQIRKNQEEIKSNFEFYRTVQQQIQLPSKNLVQGWPAVLPCIPSTPHFNSAPNWQPLFHPNYQQLPYNSFNMWI